MFKNTWVLDIECLVNCFHLCFIDFNSDEVKEFTFFQHIDKEEYLRLLAFMETRPTLITFNGLKYDGPMLAYLIFDPDYVKNGLLGLSKLRKMSDAIILHDEKIEYSYKRMIDITKIMHYENENKKTSLKWVMFQRRAKNIIEMENLSDVTAEELPELILYCRNDTLETKYLAKDLIPEIEYRKQVSKRYGLKCINWNSTKIGSELMLLKYCQKTGADIREVRQKRTYRTEVEVNRILSNKIRFHFPVFKQIFDDYKKLVITQNTEFKRPIRLNDTDYNFSLGGIHACYLPGKYVTDDENIIISLDVKSYYPTLAIEEGWYPQHLGREFVDSYREIRDSRFEAQEKGDKLAAESLKLSLNSVFGNSKSFYSPYKDDAFFYSITINGQLFLAMLAERCTEEAGAKMLMLNTDGVEMMIPRDKLPIIEDVVDRWSKLTGFPLKIEHYNRVIIRDVNNYMAVNDKNKVKSKGCFLIDKDLHQNSSKRIIPIMLREYFMYGIPGKDTVENHLHGMVYDGFENHGIFDFCIGHRAKKSAGGAVYENVGYKLVKDEIVRTKLQKTVRFFISETGMFLFKESDKRKSAICQKYAVTVFNEYFEGDYRVKFDYYLKEFNKIVEVIETKQTTLL